MEKAAKLACDRQQVFDFRLLYETDKMGVVHHSNYIRWMEEGRTAFLEDIGLPYQVMEEAGILSPVTGVAVEYKRPSLTSSQAPHRLASAGGGKSSLTPLLLLSKSSPRCWASIWGTTTPQALPSSPCTGEPKY